MKFMKNCCIHTCRKLSSSSTSSFHSKKTLTDYPCLYIYTDNFDKNNLGCQVLLFNFFDANVAKFVCHNFEYEVQPQSKNYLERPPSQFIPFDYRGSSHWRKSAACPKFDMVWLNLSPILVGRRGVTNFLLQMIFTCLRYTQRGGGGGRVGALWVQRQNTCPYF